MYTVKITGPTTITFRMKQVRLPATFKKVSEKELKLLKVLCRSMNVQYEILEEDSERLVSLVEKLRDDKELGEPNDIENTEVKIEDLFESDDSMGDLLKSLKEG